MNEPRHQAFDALYLSPHLDDAVLSCGGQIHRHTASGRRVAVLTVFAGDIPPGPLGKLEADVLRWMGLDRETGMADRRAEDEKACGRLGAESLHWQIPEAPSRDRSLSDLESLFVPSPELDEALIADLAERLGEFRNVPEIVAPLGFGSHLDHHTVRHAAHRAFGDRIAYYEDFPYVLKVDQVTGRPETARLTPSIVELDPSDVAARVEAIKHYTSQIRALFGPWHHRLLPGRSVGAKVRRYVKKVGGERLRRE